MRRIPVTAISLDLPRSPYISPYLPVSPQVRRILVIAISTTMLRNQITALNWLGIGVAFVGVLGYSLSP